MIGTALSFGLIPITGGSGLTLPGARAGVRITSTTPAFTEIMVPQGIDYSKAFTIVKLERKENSREYKLIEVKMGLLGAGGEDTSQKNLIAIDITEGSNCIYRGRTFLSLIIKPMTPLDPGEYALMLPNQLFAFGIDE